MTHANDSGPKRQDSKKPAPSVGALEVSQSNNSGKRSIHSSKSNDKESSSKISTKSLQLQNRSLNKNSRPAEKKSVEIRGTVKESHKKHSSVDKEKSSGGRLGDKKDPSGGGGGGGRAGGVIKVNAGRKQSSPENKKSGPTQVRGTKSGANKTRDLVDNKPTAAGPGQPAEKKKVAGREGSSVGPSVGPRTIEKASSSVSLVRKKFERKIESPELSDKKPSQRMPKVKISQNLFLAGDVNAKKKSESPVDPGANEADKSEANKGYSEHHNANSLENFPGESLQSDPSDRSPVPSPCTPPSPGPPSLPNAESVTSLSRAQTRHNLNIDDPTSNEIDLCFRSGPDSCDNDDNVPGPDRSTGLENELPESPAYRSPLLSDSEAECEDLAGTGAPASSRHHVLEAFVGGNDEPSLRNKLLTNLVNKRSESDGIVCFDRPRPEISVRRCESIDNAIDLVNRSIENIPEPPTVHFPQNIKTVTPATIMKGPDDYSPGLQETVYLRTHYFGNPEPRVIWFKGGRRLNPTDRVKIRTYPGESTLVIRDLRADDSGKYEIQIENEVGSDGCSASLCVEGPPEPPGGRPYITTIDIDALRLTLAWYGSTFDGGSMLTGYIIEMSSWPIITDSQQPETTDWTIVTSKCHSTSFIVKNLDPDREYIFRVRAQNIHGQSAPGKVSEPVSFMKLEDGFDEQEPYNSDDEDFDAPFEHRIVRLEDGSIFKDSFDIYEELGRGRFGVVFKVKDKDSREVFAAKFVRCRKQEEREKCKEEINIMNGLDHSRLLQLAAAYETPREVIMIMEFIGGGELFEKVVADDFTLTEHDCVLFMRQICQAIGYMHHKDIVHLDLKPENILCKSKKSHQIKIIDFGLTRKLKPGEDVRILFGTPEFVSPEVISYEPVSAASDMWSVGVVCYVLLSGLSPFMGETDVETFANITGLNYDFDDEAFEHISEDAKDFIHKLLTKDQRRRLKALECLKHPWLDHRDSDKRSRKEINTDKLKSFLMRRRWQKAAHAIRALGRFTSLGFRADAKDSASSIALSTQSADF